MYNLSKDRGFLTPLEADLSAVGGGKPLLFYFLLGFRTYKTCSPFLTMTVSTPLLPDLYTLLTCSIISSWDSGVFVMSKMILGACFLAFLELLSMTVLPEPVISFRSKGTPAIR